MLIQLRQALVRPWESGKAGKAASLFKAPLSLTIGPDQRWAITGPQKSLLLRVLAGSYVCKPAASRTFPFLAEGQWPTQVTKLVEFTSAPQAIRATHLSSRYESLREDLDQNLNEFLLDAAHGDQARVEKALSEFRLEDLRNQWVVELSNGQNRRARLAHSALRSPAILLMDEPFLGLDPEAVDSVSAVLEEMPPSPHVVLGLRPQDPLPSWITHAAIVDESGIVHQGNIAQVQPYIDELRKQAQARAEDSHQLRAAKRSVAGLDERAANATAANLHNVPLFHLDNITVRYRGKTVFDKLNWTIWPGERWHLQGKNGSGKSTLLSLLTADHPQSWSANITMAGVPRRAGRQSYFGINEAIGHASPEIHAIFPSSYSVHRTIASGFTVGSFLVPKTLTEQQEKTISALMAEFGLQDLADTPLRDLPLAQQKLALFLRAVVKNPDLLILDEAFSGMDPEMVEHCKRFVDSFQGTVIAIGHVREEVVYCDYYFRLTGGQPEVGLVDYATC